MRPGGSYQQGKMSKIRCDRRDRLVRQILDASRALHEERLVRVADLVVEQDDLGPFGRTILQSDVEFYQQHRETDVRLSIVLVVRAVDR